MKNAIMNLFGLNKIKSKPEPATAKNDLDAFIRDFVNGLDNPIIMGCCRYILKMKL